MLPLGEGERERERGRVALGLDWIGLDWIGLDLEYASG